MSAARIGMIDRRRMGLGIAAAVAVPAFGTPSPASIDTLVAREMARTGTRGLALALIEDGRPVLVRAYGARDATGAPLRTDTVMYAASLTKAVFAFMVMELVDEGRLALDRPIAALLPRPLPSYGNVEGYGHWGDLAGDERWRAITPRMVLTHSTGFANFSFLEPDGRLRIHFDPGTRYAYSGEGVILLQFALEQGLALDVGREMQARVFDRFGMANSSMTWRPDFARNLADGWIDTGKPVPHDQRSRTRAAGSLDTTIADMARFAAAFMRGEGPSARGRAEMVRPQLPITTASQFPTLQPEAPPGARVPGLSAGLGVVTFTGPQGRGFYKGGHNDSTGNIWIGLGRGRRSLVLLGNDVRAERAYPALVAALLGETDAPWRWEYPEQFA